MGGGGLDGYFGEQRLPVGIHECLERFHRGCVDNLSRQFFPKWDSPNGESELATARVWSLESTIWSNAQPLLLCTHYPRAGVALAKALCLTFTPY